MAESKWCHLVSHPRSARVNSGFEISTSNIRVPYLLSRSINDGVLVSVLEFLDGIDISNDAFGAHQAGRDSVQDGY